MSKAPAFQFYTGDWLKDPRLSMCSPATRGIWVDLLCAFHESDRSGQATATTEQFARICRCSPVEFVNAVAELESTKAADVTKRNGLVTIACRRMQRESAERQAAAIRQANFRDRGGGDPEQWTAIRAQVLLRDGKRCAYCGKRASTVDHVIPRSQGGSHELSNLVAACKSCNQIKGSRTPAEAGMDFWPGFDVIAILGSNLKVTGKQLGSNAYSSSSSSPSGGERAAHPPSDDFQDLAPQLSPTQSTLCQICRLEPELLAPQAYADLTEAARKLDVKGVTVAQIAEFERRWFAEDWRGQKGDPPTPKQVCNEWGKRMKTASGGGMRQECPRCKGLKRERDAEGRMSDDDCKRCNGAGIVTA